MSHFLWCWGGSFCLYLLLFDVIHRLMTLIQSNLEMIYSTIFPLDGGKKLYSDFIKLSSTVTIQGYSLRNWTEKTHHKQVIRFMIHFHTSSTSTIKLKDLFECCHAPWPCVQTSWVGVWIHVNYGLIYGRMIVRAAFSKFNIIEM